MKKALTTEDLSAKKRQTDVASYRDKTFNDLSQEDKDKLFKFLLEQTNLIKQS